MGSLPSVFIGSSVEGLVVAKSLQTGLNYVADPERWDQATFELSGTTIESLEKKAGKVDFAIFVITPDDIVIKRQKKRIAPRDNVLFELGLFAGSLGRERCFIVHDEAKAIDLPTDLLGVTAAKFRMHQSGNLDASLGSVCGAIETAMKRLGPRPKSDRTLMAAFNRVNDFCGRLAGTWWELLITGKVSGISFLTIEPDPDSSSVKLADARAFDLDGNHESNWGSLASCARPDDRKIFYSWEGKMVTRPHEPFQGFGEIQFNETPGPFTRGNGSFWNTSLIDLKGTHMKVSEVRRATEKEAHDMRNGDSRTFAALVKKKIQSW